MFKKYFQIDAVIKGKCTRLKVKFEEYVFVV